MDNNWAQNPAIFPEIHFIIQPIVRDISIIMDDLSQTYPDQNNYQKMLNHCYIEVIRTLIPVAGDEGLQSEISVLEEIPEIPLGVPGISGMPSVAPPPCVPYVPHVSHSSIDYDLLYDMISILLLSELLRTRGYSDF
jgi:hypothetical protein